MNDDFNKINVPLPNTPKISKTSKESVFLIILFGLIFCLVGVYSALVFIQKNKNIELPKQDTNKSFVIDDKKQDENETNSKLNSFLKNQSELKNFKSEKEVREFLENNSSNYGGYYNTKNISMMRSEQGLALSAPESKINLWGNDRGGNDYSKTNIQVQGVDEPDIVKTDGQNIYVSTKLKNSVYIIQTSQNKKMEILSEIQLKNQPQNIFVYKDRLVIFGNDDDFYNQPLYKTIIRRSPFTFIHIYDITDKSKPILVKDLKLEGSYMNARLIKDNVYFVVNTYGYEYIENEPLLPRVFDGEKNILTNSFNAHYFDIPYTQQNITTVASFNILNTDAEINLERFILNGSENLYVSENNLYLTQTKYIDDYLLQIDAKKYFLSERMPQRDKDKIIQIENTPQFILSNYEKLNKIDQIYNKYLRNLSEDESIAFEKNLKEYITNYYKIHIDEIEQTVIHKIKLEDGKITYETTGNVPGYVLNQFSMDEYNGNFRIATTRGSFGSWWLNNESNEENQNITSNIETNNLYVLGNDMKIIGKLINLAKGERIYSARFMGERAFLVTFKQMDPFFVIDLKNPQEPSVLGELKLPGFSEYLHPYNENIIIGFGRETETDKNNNVVEKGLKLTLFDITDLSKPKEIHSEILGGRGSYSIALNDHKAFLFSKEKNLLAIPVTLRKVTPEGYWGDINFQGLMVYNVTENGFSLKGKIEHLNNTSKKDVKIPEYIYMPDNSILRSLYIKDVLYTISDYSIQGNFISNLGFTSKLELYKPENNIPYPLPIPVPFIRGAEETF